MSLCQTAFLIKGFFFNTRIPKLKDLKGCGLGLDVSVLRRKVSVSAVNVSLQNVDLNLFLKYKIT